MNAKGLKAGNQPAVRDVQALVMSAAKPVSVIIAVSLNNVPKNKGSCDYFRLQYCENCVIERRTCCHKTRYYIIEFWCM